MGVRGSLWSTPWGKVGGEGRENDALGLSQPSSIEGAQADEECGCPLCLERSGQICPDQAKHVRCCLVLKALLGSHPWDGLAAWVESHKAGPGAAGHSLGNTSRLPL